MVKQKWHVVLKVVSVAALFIFLVGCSNNQGSGGDQAQKGSEQNTQTAQNNQTEQKSTTPTQKLITVGTKGGSGNAYILWAALSQTAQKFSDLQVRLRDTGSIQSSLELMQRGEVDTYLASCPDASDAYLGKGPFEGKPDNSIRTLFMTYPAYIGFVTTKDSGIKQLTDFKGKTVAVYPGAVFLYETMKEALSIAGLEAGKDYKELKFTDVAQSASLVLEGNADAYGISLPGTHMQEMKASPHGIQVIPYPESVIAELQKRGRPVMGTPYPDKMISDYNLQGVLGIKYYTQTIIREEVPEDTVYTMVKSILENYDDYKDASSAASEVTLKNAIIPEALTVPVHPGAIKYYKEKGIWTEADETKNNELLKLGKSN